MAGTEAEFYRSLGDRIRVLRRERRMTQATLADVMEIPRTSLILVERGEQRVHAYELIQLASVLGTTPEALIQDVAPQSPRQSPDIPSDATPAVRQWISAAQAPAVDLTFAPRRRR